MSKLRNFPLKSTIVDADELHINDYWIYSIAFDSKGTAWLGTFKQGLIKYNPDGTGLVYNSTNTILPDEVPSFIALCKICSSGIVTSPFPQCIFLLTVSSA